uniref:Uncharacterized protein n=2 Tax=Cuerna arida TaxID=1464854 RepID=A0A1B6GPK7_9HEMI
MVLQTLSVAQPPAVAQWLAGQHMPAQGQVVVQLKTRLVWQLGHDAGFTWQELSQEMLDLKETCCRDVLLVLNTLRFGHCRMKGLILLELHGSLCEKQKRKHLGGVTDQITMEEARAILATARTILQDDAAAQTELNLQTEEQQRIEALST